MHNKSDRYPTKEEHPVLQILWDDTSTKIIPGIWKTCSNCGRLNCFKGVCQSTARQGKQTGQKKTIHEMQQDEEESMHETDDKSGNHIVHRTSTVIYTLKPNACMISDTHTSKLVTSRSKMRHKSSNLTSFACQFGWYRYERFLFWSCPPGDMFQHKIYEIFKEFLNVFGIADYILIIICRIKLKLNNINATSGALDFLSLGKLFPDMRYNLSHEKCMHLHKYLCQSLRRSYNHS